MKKKEKENIEVEELKENPEETAEETEGTAAEAEKTDEEQPEVAEEEASEEESEEKKAEEKEDKKKDKKQELIEELQDRVKRQLAEFENFRNRTEKEKSQMFEVGAKSVIEKMLPIVDNFERGLTDAPDDAFSEGMQMIYKQMMTAFEQLGVTPIEAVGKEFDPEFHNAVMHIDDENYGENEIVEELQKGYMYRETVVRHSMVKVAN